MPASSFCISGDLIRLRPAQRFSVTTRAFTLPPFSPM